MKPVKEVNQRSCEFWRCDGKGDQNHTDECRQDWRNKILSYHVQPTVPAGAVYHAGGTWYDKELMPIGGDEDE